MKKKYKPFDKFIVRFPSLPFNSYNWDFDDFYKKPFFKEAIYIASPDLYDEMIKYENDQLKTAEERKRVKLSLLKYWYRMRTRTTPFGLFAGISIGEVNNTSTAFKIMDEYNKNIRLDMQYFYALLVHIENIKEIKNSIKYFPNDSIYVSGSKYRYIERKYTTKRFEHDVVQVDKSSVLTDLLKLSKKGETIENLISYLLSFEVDYEDASAYIDELIDAQLLISELNPPVTSPDLLQRTIDILSGYNIQDPILNRLKNIKSNLLQIRNNNDLDLYDGTINEINEIGIPFEKNYVFQTDLTKNFSELNLDRKVLNDILGSILFLYKVNPFTKENKNIEDFKKYFQERYEDQEVSLLTVIDPDLGIGYPVNSNSDKYRNSLIDGFYLPRQAQSNKNQAQSTLLQKILNHQKPEAEEIILTDEDFPEAQANNQISPVFMANFEILKMQNESLLHLISFGDNSGAKMLARFSHTEKRIENFVKEIADKEQELSDVIIAEINHLPTPRMGNVSQSSNFRKFEITCLSNSDLNEKQTIPLSDLFISVKNNKIVLRSKKLQSEIRPILTNAYNFSLSSLPVYSLLCDLQFQDNYVYGASLNTDPNIEYIPRIKYKNVILQYATWNCQGSDLKEIGSEKDQDKKIDAFLQWQKLKRIPQYFILSESDRELLINSLVNDDVLLFLNEIKAKKQFTLHEFLFDEGENILTDKNMNNYRNQIITAFHS
ncbi:lantibiotic dehydratase family protein [Chryseobacterium luteum]|uniref:Lantibiotic dehydratase N-terminal domain-containing protein n=1 Tax=Chryseobacterium luteum TaxID=421531 RepID=A0A085ZY82_9FLAO|nr:lantibiotic dehydratase family protein [Chryseobacterium luteum]KFF09396.1 hypothetical protein IX38_02540 [Chryseobacterium luteum]